MSWKVEFYKWLARITAKMAANAATEHATEHAIDLKEREDRAIEFANSTRPKFMEVRELWEGQSE